MVNRTLIEGGTSCLPADMPLKKIEKEVEAKELQNGLILILKFASDLLHFDRKTLSKDLHFICSHSTVDRSYLQTDIHVHTLCAILKNMWQCLSTHKLLL